MELDQLREDALLVFHLKGEGPYRTFTHVTISCDCAPLPSSMTYSSSWKAHQTHPIPQFSLTMEFQQGDVIIQGLAVVIVMDVCCSNSESLSSRASVFSGEVIISHANINSISCKRKNFRSLSSLSQLVFMRAVPEIPGLGYRWRLYCTDFFPKYQH